MNVYIALIHTDVDESRLHVYHGPWRLIQSGKRREFSSSQFYEMPLQRVVLAHGGSFKSYAPSEGLVEHGNPHSANCRSRCWGLHFFDYR